jgi:hypothetical protein
VVHLQPALCWTKGMYRFASNCFVIIVIQRHYGLTCMSTSLVGVRSNNAWHY